MDATGVVVGLIALLWDCYNKCKNDSASFYNLHRDLHSLHTTLRLVERYLPDECDLGAIQIGCNQIVVDIEKVLSGCASLNTTKKKLWHQLKWGFEDIEQLRSRLIAQVSMLNACVSVMSSRGLHLNVQDQARSAGSSQSSSLSVRDDDQIWNDIYQELRKYNAPESSIETVKILVLERSASLGSCLDTPSPLTTAESLVDTSEVRDAPLVENRHSLNSDSSITFGKREQNSLYATFKSKFKRSRSKFTAAAKGGDVITLSKLLSQVDERTINKALIAVSNNGEVVGEQADVVRLLLSWGASLACTDSDYHRTPLIWAIIVGRDDLVELLLEKQALIEARDWVWDWTPLMWAVWLGSEAIINRLIEKEASLEAADGIWKRTPLLWAARIGNHRVAEILLQKNGQLIKAEDKDKLTPLALAYVEGHEEAVRLFVKHGDNTNFKFKSGLPLLEWAVMAGDEGFVRLLVENGADVQCTDMDGVPALTVAVKQEYLAIADLLIQKGAALEATDGLGCTALLWAVWRKNDRIVEMLVAREANTSAVDGDGCTVREWAEWTRNKRIIQLVS